MEKKEKYKLKRKEAIEASSILLSDKLQSLIKFYWLQDIIFYFIDKDKNDLEEMSEDEYLEKFINGKEKDELQFIYQQAWNSKNFEIELYWKRATYFWAFQIAAFTAYFAVINSINYNLEIPKHPEILFFVICIGTITSTSWALINKGSKVWQRHWENHVDMLEDKVTGPLYKIVTQSKTFSVTKINEIVSRFFVFLWILLGLKFYMNHLTLNPFNNGGINYLVLLSLSLTLYFLGAMYLGHGRGRFGEREVKFYKRSFSSRNL